MTAPACIRSGRRTKCRPDDREIAALAGHQHGVVARGQLLALGFHPGALRRRIAVGRLHPLHIGVYAVGHRSVSQHGRWMAAVLSCGSGALLCHRSGAALTGLLLTGGSGIDVTARTRRGRPGIVLHHHRSIDAEDRTTCDGIPVTATPRLLLDLAYEVVSRRLRLRHLDRAVEEADVKGLLDMRAMDRFLARSRGHPGVRVLRSALGEHRPQVFTRSELERRFLELCRRSGLPPPAANLFVAGAEADMVWTDGRLVVELDGHESHRTRTAFERDRLRDAALQLAGYRVLRITYRRLQDAPTAVVQTVRSLLDSP